MLQKVWKKWEPNFTVSRSIYTVTMENTTLIPHKTNNKTIISSVQSLSRIQLCDPMDCSTSFFPVHHQLLEIAQTHAHQVSDAIQPSHPLLSPFPPPLVFSIIRIFSNESILCIRQPKKWSFSFNISPSISSMGTNQTHKLLHRKGNHKQDNL